MGFFDFLFGKKQASAAGSQGSTKEGKLNSAPKSTLPEAAATQEEDWENQGTPQEMQPAEVLELLQGNNPPQLLDVREVHELQADGKIPGAIHIPLGEVQMRCTELDKSRPVIVYCASGMRSFDAGFELIQQGFTDVSNLNGGIHAWPGEKEPYS
ncbi:MAG: rhodanese-like domain-containing protein [Sumerlaeia bacterium]